MHVIAHVHGSPEQTIGADDMVSDMRSRDLGTISPLTLFCTCFFCRYSSAHFSVYMSF